MDGRMARNKSNQIYSTFLCLGPKRKQENRLIGSLEAGGLRQKTKESRAEAEISPRRLRLVLPSLRLGCSLDTRRSCRLKEIHYTKVNVGSWDGFYCPAQVKRCVSLETGRLVEGEKRG